MADLKIRFVLEMLGKPADYMLKGLNLLLDQIEKEKGVQITSKEIHNPVSVEKTDLFTSFAEVEAEIEALTNYFAIMYKYHPSQLELISPEKVTLTNSELNELSGFILQNIHDYDQKSKTLKAQRDLALEKLKEKAPELFEKKESKPKTSKKKSPKKKSRKKS